jgi:hypothetical protein
MRLTLNEIDIAINAAKVWPHDHAVCWDLPDGRL